MGPREAIPVIARDLKTSTYFRIWFLAFIIVAFVGFIGIFVIASCNNYSDMVIEKEVKNPYIQTWRVDVKQFSIPSFNFTTLYVDGTYSENTFESVSCHQLGNNKDLPFTANISNNGHLCSVFPRSRTIQTSNEDFITCKITLYTPTNYAFVHIRPYNSFSDMTHPIIPSKPSSTAVLYLTQKTTEDEPDVNTNENEWSMKIYNNDYIKIESNITIFDVQVRMNPSFTKDKYIVQDPKKFTQSYKLKMKGIITAAHIGGFWFFLSIIHMMFMFLVSFCFAKDSQFLYPQEMTYGSV